jgi:homoserine O-succinyltransferase/O-acetyltransferase
VSLRLSSDVGGGEQMPQAPGAEGASWTCALVNIMPQHASAKADRQFLDWLAAGSDSDVIDVHRYAISDVVGQELATEVSDLEAIWQQPPDLLVVTGTEPLAPSIADEPYWDDLVRLLTWGSEHVSSMFLSCLSAHAALALFDGLERITLPAKCTGVRAQQADASSALATDLPVPMVLPHSHVNAVPLDDVEAAGYHVALRSDSIDWSIASKVIGRASVVLVQGHPEYGASTLLREYHRDVKRYLLSEDQPLPCLPEHCAAAEDWESLQRLQQRIVAGDRDPALIDFFPFADALKRAPWSWHPLATKLCFNWLAGVPKRSA